MDRFLQVLAGVGSSGRQAAYEGRSDEHRYIQEQSFSGSDAEGAQNGEAN